MKKESMDDFDKTSLLPCLHEALHEVFGLEAKTGDLVLRPTPKDFEGTHTLVLFPLAKRLKKPPKEIGEQLGAHLTERLKAMDAYTVVGGFLNIRLSDTHWIKTWQAICQEENFGVLPSKGARILIEFCSPNTNKPLHLGHLRNIFLGDALAAIFEAVGYEVMRCCLYNDRGAHICKSMVAYEQLGRGETPQSTGLKGDHLVGKYYTLFEKKYREEIQQLVSRGYSEEEAKAQAPSMQAAQALLKKWEHNDRAIRALWAQMNEWAYEGFRETYARLGVSFDKVYYESQTYLLGKKMVEEGLKKGLFYAEKDGAVWVDLQDSGLDKKLLLRSDGTSVYITQDLGTAEKKHEDFKADRSYYVLGDEQIYHFEVLSHILQRLQRPYATSSYHLSYGMVRLPSGKMKSREGTVVEADQLLDSLEAMAKTTTHSVSKKKEIHHNPLLYRQLALGAVKFFFTKIQAKKGVLFQVEKSVDLQGVTGTFIQYTHARISSLLQKAGASGIAPSLDYTLTTCHSEERTIIVQVLSYPRILEEAAKACDPAQFAMYLYELARAYNRFYAACPVLQEKNNAVRAFRLSLSVMTQRVLRRGMRLLGIAVPEKM